jgi:hypothetical protein
LTYDFIVSPPTPFGHVRWQIRWQSNDFNVSIPSCTGELGRGEKLSLAEAGSTMKSWGELGRAWQRLRQRGTELGSGEEQTLAFMLILAQRIPHFLLERVAILSSLCFPQILEA